MTSHGRSISICFREALTIRGLTLRMGGELVVKFRCNESLMSSRFLLSSILGCPQDELWFFHRGERLIPGLEDPICWRNVPGIFRCPYVHLVRRRRPPFYLRDLTEVELERIRGKRFLALKIPPRSPCPYFDPSYLTEDEIYYVRVVSLLVTMRERASCLPTLVRELVRCYYHQMHAIKTLSPLFLDSQVELIMNWRRPNDWMSYR